MQIYFRKSTLSHLYKKERNRRGFDPEGCWKSSVYPTSTSIQYFSTTCTCIQYYSTTSIINLVGKLIMIFRPPLNSRGALSENSIFVHSHCIYICMPLDPKIMAMDDIVVNFSFSRIYF